MEFTRPCDLFASELFGMQRFSTPALTIVRPHGRDDRARGDACDCARFCTHSEFDDLRVDGDGGDQNVGSDPRAKVKPVS
jgi:hypothetical protein